MQIESARALATEKTRARILDVALEILGQNPDAGMGDVASAAGVVRRTVYGHFPTRTDLVQALARQAVSELETALIETEATDESPGRVWVAFVNRLWPLAHRYRVLLTLRRGEYGHEIHSLLTPVDRALADLVARGQSTGVFGQHLPAAVLSQVAFSAIFSLADSGLSDTGVTSERATFASLLLLGVPDARATSLTGGAISR